MASSGKKGKKSKGKTLALNAFLQETPGPAPTLPIRKANLNWADEVENSCDIYESRPKTNVVLPTAPKAARGLDDYSDKVPQEPPYMAYLSNLPYDVSENEIADFFKNLKISNMRIPKDDKSGEIQKLKGFGYVEFKDRGDLLQALATPDCTIKGRRIRIEVASNSENDRRRGGRMDMGRDRGDRPEMMSDWRSRAEPVDTDRRPPPPSRDTMTSWRDTSDRPSFREDRFNRDGDRKGFDRDGDRKGFDRDGERKGFDRDGERKGFDRDGDRKPFDRDSDRRGFDRDGDRRGFDRDGDRRGFDRGFNRDGRRGFGPRQDDRNGSYRSRDDVPERNEPRERPKLNLKPRTIPLEESSAQVSQDKEPELASGASKIFGGAKPVDTTAREREIEEILAKETYKSNLPRDERRREGDRSPRRGSAERRRFSPGRRRPSPDRRRPSPDRKRPSPDRRRNSLDRRRSSPDRRRNSPDGRRVFPERKRNSPDRKDPPPRRRRSSDRSDSQKSPDYNLSSPDRKEKSPTRRRGSIDRNKSPERPRGATGRKNDSDTKTDKPQQREKDKPRREREMPKLKEPEPPNFVGSNKYAFLASDEDSN